MSRPSSRTARRSAGRGGGGRGGCQGPRGLEGLAGGGAAGNRQGLLRLFWRPASTQLTARLSGRPWARLPSNRALAQHYNHRPLPFPRHPPKTRYGFIVMDGNGALFGTLSGNSREVLHKVSRPGRAPRPGAVLGSAGGSPIALSRPPGSGSRAAQHKSVARSQGPWWAGGRAGHSCRRRRFFFFFRCFAARWRSLSVACRGAKASRGQSAGGICRLPALALAGQEQSGQC